MNEATVNRRMLLCRRPSGPLSADDYELVHEPLGDPADGDALVETAFLAMDPVTRVMLGADIKVMPPIPLGAAIRGFGVGTVVASRRDDFPIGTRMTGFFEWADYQRVATDPRARRLPDDVSFIQALNLYGHTAHAAYFGMIDVGEVAKGDTVVVTGASGAVGSIAAQIARIMGARVIGTAGTAEKCAWLTDELRLDGAVNYRSANVANDVARLAPGGIDILFDNVGGPLLDGLIGQVAQGARIVLCGAMAQYLGDDPLATTHDDATAAARGATVRRFNAMDYAARFDESFAATAKWEEQGRLKVATTIVPGLEHAPDALNSLFEGTAEGRVLVDVRGGRAMEPRSL